MRAVWSNKYSISMGDLTRTFGGLIIMAQRVNSQTLKKSLHTCILLDMFVHIYFSYISYIFNDIFFTRSATFHLVFSGQG